MSIDMKVFSKKVMCHFKKICKIYRKSGHEKEIADYLESFVKGLVEQGQKITVERQASQNEKKPINNLVIKKSATPGYEDVPPIALQAHIDMVCQPEKADFFKGVQAYMVDSERMMGRSAADGETPTTLGADDGIGVACIMAILESTDLKHPPIEAILTSDEEDGMSGADNLDMSMVTANRLINIDTEEERKFFYGCAGGIYANMTLQLKKIELPENMSCLNITIDGLHGGHSGLMIDKHRANANRLMGRLLSQLRYMLAANGHEICLININGGTAHNAITKKAEALIAVSSDAIPNIYKYVDEIKAGFNADYPIETKLEISIDSPNCIPTSVMDKRTADGVIKILCDVPNGVIAMHESVPNLVETSSNIGMVKCEDDNFYATSFIRSSVGDKKRAVKEQIEQIAKGVGAEFFTENDFPEWNPNPNSKLKRLFEDTYLDIFKVQASTESIHAGLECGYFAVKRPDMDIIAIGPTITGAHTEEETLYVSTVEKVAQLLVAVLERLDKNMEAELDSSPLCCANDFTHTHEGHVCAR